MKNQILKAVKELNLPYGEYIISGSGVLSVRNIRKHNDIDILVSKNLWDDLLEKHGWKISAQYDTTIVHPNKAVEAKTSLCWMESNPTIKDLLPRADYFDNVPFLSLQDLIESKLALGRDKDLKDVDVIKSYLANKNVN